MREIREQEALGRSRAQLAGSAHPARVPEREGQMPHRAEPETRQFIMHECVACRMLDKLPRGGDLERQGGTVWQQPDRAQDGTTRAVPAPRRNGTVLAATTAARGATALRLCRVTDDSRCHSSATNPAAWLGHVPLEVKVTGRCISVPRLNT